MESMKCRQVRARLLLFQEGELEPRESAQVRDHLRDCPRCGALAEALAETQDQVEAALSTAMAAPPTLEARVMATVRRLPERRLQWPAFAPPWSWQRRLATVGAALCLVPAGFLAGFLTGRAPFGRATPPQASPQPSPPRTTIAQAPAAQVPATQVLELASLRKDHLQSLASPRAVTVMGHDPRQVSQHLGRSDDCLAVPVSLSASGAKLLGGRWHRVAGAPVAFLCYEWNGQRISLYQADGRRLALPALRAMEQRRATGGQRCYVIEQEGSLSSVAWCSGMTNYVLVAQAAPERLLHLAQCASIVARGA